VLSSSPLPINEPIVIDTIVNQIVLTPDVSQKCHLLRFSVSLLEVTDALFHQKIFVFRSPDVVQKFLIPSPLEKDPKKHCAALRKNLSLSSGYIPMSLLCVLRWIHLGTNLSGSEDRRAVLLLSSWMTSEADNNDMGRLFSGWQLSVAECLHLEMEMDLYGRTGLPQGYGDQNEGNEVDGLKANDIQVDGRFSYMVQQRGLSVSSFDSISNAIFEKYQQYRYRNKVKLTDKSDRSSIRSTFLALCKDEIDFFQQILNSMVDEEGSWILEYVSRKMNDNSTHEDLIDFLMLFQPCYLFSNNDVSMLKASKEMKLKSISRLSLIINQFSERISELFKCNCRKNLNNGRGMNMKAIQCLISTMSSGLLDESFWTHIFKGIISPLVNSFGNSEYFSLECEVVKVLLFFFL